jgi:hypothetical protein
MATPTSRTLDYFRKHNYIAGVVERYLPIPGGRPTRVDLFGFIDLVAINKDNGHTVFIQATSGSGVSARVKKIIGHEHFPTVIKSGGAILVFGWRKLKVKRGGKAMRWQPLIVDVKAVYEDEKYVRER